MMCAFLNSGYFFPGSWTACSKTVPGGLCHLSLEVTGGLYSKLLCSRYCYEHSAYVFEEMETGGDPHGKFRLWPELNCSLPRWCWPRWEDQARGSRRRHQGGRQT